MLNIFESNHIDRLFSTLSKKIKINQSHVLAPTQLVVTSFGVEQWLLKSLTRDLGVFVNGQFDFPLNFINKITNQLEIEYDEYYHEDVLHLRLFKLLQDPNIQKQIEHIDHLLYRYLFEQDAFIIENRLWKISQTLAQIFDSYQWQRIDWLKHWENHHLLFTNTSLQTKEKIQSLLWRALITQDANHQTLPLYHRIEKIIIALNNTKRTKLSTQLSYWNNGVHIWHVLPLTPLVRQLVEALSQYIEIYLYFLNPSIELWSESLYLPMIEESLSQYRINSPKEQNPMDLFFQHHPILMATGQVGAQCHKQLLEITSAHIESDFTTSLIQSNQSLLSRIQHDILQDLPESHIPPIDCDINDLSLQIHCCPDRLTELSNLHHEIVKWLKEDSCRNYEDIIILAPNIADYTDSLPIIFKEMPIIFPQNPNQDGLYEAFSFFLHLINDDTSLTINQLKKFLTFSVVQNKLHELGASDQTDQFIDLLYQQGFRWGFTDYQRQQYQYDKGISLETALNQFWLDVCLSNELPLNQWQNFSHLHEYIKKLVHTFALIHAVNAKNKSIEQWLQQWRYWLADFFLLKHPSQSELNDYKCLLTRYTHIQKQGNTAQLVQPISLATMLSLWQKNSQQAPTSTYYAPEKLICANLLDLSSVPAKFIAILGLDERYSQQNQSLYLDLAWQLPQPYDRSEQANHYYCILQCIQVVREKLWLSYSFEDNQQILNPSMPLSAVMDYVQNYLSDKSLLKQIIIHHECKVDLSAQYFKPEVIKQEPANTENKIDNQKSVSLFYCQELAHQLAQPIKTYLHHYGTGTLAMKPTELYDDIEKNTHSYLDRFFWRMDLIKLLLCQSIDTDQAITILIDKYASQKGYLSTEIIQQNLRSQVPQITQVLEKKNLHSIGEQIVTPILYQYRQNQEWISLCAQPDIMSRLGNQQISISGGGGKISKLLQLWLNHLVLNTTTPTTSTYLYFHNNKLITYEIPMCDPIKAENKLQELMELSLTLRYTPLWVPPQLLFDITLNKETLSQQKTIIENNFFQKEHKSPWLALLNDDKVYDLSEQGKTWQDSLYYVKKLWEI